MKKRTKRKVKHTHNEMLVDMNLKALAAGKPKSQEEIKREAEIAQTFLNRFTQGNYGTSKMILSCYAMYFASMANICKCEVSDRIARDAFAAIESGDVIPIQIMLGYYIQEMHELSSDIVDRVFHLAVDTICLSVVDGIKDELFTTKIKELAQGESVYKLADDAEVKRNKAITMFVNVFHALTVIYRTDLKFHEIETANINTIRENCDWVVKKVDGLKARALHLTRNVLVGTQNLGIQL